MKPSIGRVVLFTLNEQDAAAIKRQRNSFPHGNEARAGDQYPAIIVRVWTGGSVNLSVQLDGPDTYWATSVSEGAAGDEHRWIWPPRV